MSANGVRGEVVRESPSASHGLTPNEEGGEGRVPLVDELLGGHRQPRVLQHQRDADRVGTAHHDRPDVGREHHPMAFEDRVRRGDVERLGVEQRPVEVVDDVGDPH